MHYYSSGKVLHSAVRWWSGFRRNAWHFPALKRLKTEDTAGGKARQPSSVLSIVLSIKVYCIYLTFNKHGKAHWACIALLQQYPVAQSSSYAQSSFRAALCGHESFTAAHILDKRNAWRMSCLLIVVSRVWGSRKEKSESRKRCQSRKGNEAKYSKSWFKSRYFKVNWSRIIGLNDLAYLHIIPGIHWNLAKGSTADGWGVVPYSDSVLVFSKQGS